LFCFSPFELVILASAEKFRSGNQSIQLTAISDSLLSLSLTSPSITHKTGLLRQAVFESITIDFLHRTRFCRNARGPRPAQVVQAFSRRDRKAPALQFGHFPKAWMWVESGLRPNEP
jgi:hypothetical protein